MARRLALLLALVCALVPAGAAAAATGPPPVDARAVIVANGAGRVFYAKNADLEVPMASITKLMTAIVTLERMSPSDVVTVQSAASGVGESSIFLRVGESLSVRDLLAAALIQSANDAAFALAAAVGKGDVDAFVELMNRKARELGLAHTHYERPDGLDTPGHYSSARDVLQLARTAMQRPLVRRLVRMRSAEIAGGRSLFSWNDLLDTYPGLIGVKTGHTSDAGWCEVAAARRDGVTVYAVVLGSPGRSQRNADLAELLTWGLDHYGRVGLVTRGRTYASARVALGEERVRLVAAKSRSAVVRLDLPLVQKVVAPALVDTPVAAGDELGEVRVLQGGRIVARTPLVAATDVDEPGFGRKVSWYAGRTLDEAGDMLQGFFASVL